MQLSRPTLAIRCAYLPNTRNYDEKENGICRAGGTIFSYPDQPPPLFQGRQEEYILGTIPRLSNRNSVQSYTILPVSIKLSARHYLLRKFTSYHFRSKSHSLIKLKSISSIHFYHPTAFSHTIKRENGIRNSHRTPPSNLHFRRPIGRTRTPGLRILPYQTLHPLRSSQPRHCP